MFKRTNLFAVLKHKRAFHSSQQKAHERFRIQQIQALVATEQKLNALGGEMILRLQNVNPGPLAIRKNLEIARVWFTILKNLKSVNFFLQADYLNVEEKGPECRWQSLKIRWCDARNVSSDQKTILSAFFSFLPAIYIPPTYHFSVQLDNEVVPSFCWLAAVKTELVCTHSPIEMWIVNKRAVMRK